jgi:hypothetical protein
MAKVTVELPADEATALAQLVKRLGYDDAERLSSRYDGGEERDAMLSGVRQAATRVGRSRLRATMTGGIDGHVGNAPLAEFLRGGS